MLADFFANWSQLKVEEPVKGSFEDTFQIKLEFGHTSYWFFGENQSILRACLLEKAWGPHVGEETLLGEVTCLSI